MLANGTYSGRSCSSRSREIKSVDELGLYTGYFFTEDFAIDPKGEGEGHGQGRPRRLAELIAAIPAMDFASDATVEAGIKALAESRGLGFWRDYRVVARLAVNPAPTPARASPRSSASSEGQGARAAPANWRPLKRTWTSSSDVPRGQAQL